MVERHSEKVATCNPKETDTNPAGALNLNFPTSRTVRNKLLWFKPPVYSIFFFGSPY